MSKSSSPNGRTPWRAATQLIRGGTHRSPYGETSEAMYLTSGFVYDSAEAAEARFIGEQPGFIYSRYGNPTVAMFEERMALLEGPHRDGTIAARGVASGMAAVNAAMLCQLSAGDHVVASQAIFGSCRYVVADLLPRFGVPCTLVEGTDLAAWKKAVRPNTKTFFLESPANPTLDIIDIKAVAEIAHAAGARLVVDNVFATPILQKPFELGADVVVYSATKHIDGQGRCLGGVILSNQSFVDELLTPLLRHTGPSLSPFNAWVLLKGLETLDLRVRQHVANASAVAEFLAKDSRISHLVFPGLASHPQADLVKRQMKGPGNLISFRVKGGKAGAFRFLNNLQLIDISNNLGDAKTLVTHPATTTHQRLTPAERAELGLGDDTIRMSVGLEDVADLIEDIDLALMG